MKRKPPAENVRRVAAISNNLRGVITSKTGRIVQFESFAERSLLLRLDRDPLVEDYLSQPETFVVQRAGQTTQHYTPDFMVWRTPDLVEIHEVTLTTRRERQQCREQLASDICRTRGWRYLVHTEQTLPQGCELVNLLFLLRYRPFAYRHTLAWDYLCAYPGNTPSVSLADLAQDILAKTTLVASEVHSVLYHALWHSLLDTDLQQPWVVSTRLPVPAIEVSFRRTGGLS